MIRCALRSGSSAESADDSSKVRCDSDLSGPRHLAGLETDCVFRREPSVAALSARASVATLAIRQGAFLDHEIVLRWHIVEVHIFDSRNGYFMSFSLAGFGSCGARSATLDVVTSAIGK